MPISQRTLSGSRRTRRVFALILVTNLVIMLFPPVHLFFARGDMTYAVGFFMGSSALLVASMFVLLAIDPDKAPEEGSP